MTKGKVILITFLALLTSLCVGVDVWFAVVYFNAPNKLVVKTYEVDLQTLTDGTQRALVDVQLFKNADGKGLQAFEVKWNYVMDENRTNFYSQGTQFIGDNFDFAWHSNKLASYSCQWGFLGRLGYESQVFEMRQAFRNVAQYNYMSGNDYLYSLNDTNPINDDSFFRLTLKTGDTGNAEEDYSIYGMQFKGDYGLVYSYTNKTFGTNINHSNCLNFVEENVKTQLLWPTRLERWNYYCYLYDYNYFTTTLFKAIQTLPSGVDNYVTFKFADNFLYYSFDEDSHSYSENPLEGEELKKIRTLTESYWTIKVRINENGLTKAEQSLFNCVKGSPNFNLTNDYTEDSYLIGRTNINLNEYNFDFIHIVDNKYALKLKQSFIDYYSKYYDLIILNINIDTEKLLENNIEVVGFAANSGLDNFIVHSSNIAVSEVAYV